MVSEVELREQKEKFKQLISYRDMVLRLQKNPDFQNLILKYWCIEECARYVQASGDINLPEENRKQALEMALATGHFKRFLDVVIRMGDHAESQMESLDTAITESLDEE